MSYTTNLWIYFTLLFGIIILPGMDMLYVLTNALTGGKRAGFAATGGIMVGGAVHTIFGAVGVGVLTRLLPALYTPVLLAGAAYMAWIGLTLMRSAITVDAVGTASSRSGWVAFRQGTITCLLNPKAYLFVLAVYPQFIRPQYGAIWSQALVMGVMTVLTQLGIYGGLALAAGRSRDFLVGTPRATMVAGRAAGVLFVGIAALVAWHGIAGAKAFAG